MNDIHSQLITSAKKTAQTYTNIWSISTYFMYERRNQNHQNT